MQEQSDKPKGDYDDRDIHVIRFAESGGFEPPTPSLP